MKILFVTSEVHPLIKTGGLADVSGSLPAALQGLGADIRVLLPAYPQALQRCRRTDTLTTLDLPGTGEPVRILAGKIPGSQVPVYLVDSPPHFARRGNPYLQPDGSEWPDNAARFAVFGRAAVALALEPSRIGWRPDVVHCNDWQTGLIPALLARGSGRPATVFTVHNLAYQGLFSWHTFHSLGLPPDLWSMHGMEFHGSFSLLKGGLAFADRLTTVSPTYAREILTPEYGYGLDGLLQHRAADLSGIINGVDYEIWDPARDPQLMKNYDVHSLGGKSVNKRDLQREFGLPEDPSRMLMAFIGRMVEQKGIDLILGVLPALAELPVQLVVLGSGETVFERAFEESVRRNFDRIGVHIGYNEALAHRVQGGADVFLMPSRFEPCGLSQLYSLRYGTVPLVRRTGGLADTVIDTSLRSAINQTATGFFFEEPTAQALLAAIRRALDYYQRPSKWWHALMVAGMEQDYSWQRSAREYLALYDTLLDAKAREGRTPNG